MATPKSEIPKVKTGQTRAEVLDDLQDKAVETAMLGVGHIEEWEGAYNEYKEARANLDELLK